MESERAGSPRIRWSVIIPTYQRREVVVCAVTALAHQSVTDFEVIVVVDGSIDGTAEALLSLSTPFPLAVLEQANLGAAAARNAGARVATGDILVFIDDDMEADPAMLTAHGASHSAGADIVLGHLPLHPSSPDNILSRGVGQWASSRRDRLLQAVAVPSGDMLTGQMSISQELFHRIGGFDTEFTRDGLFGGEDVDFGYRAQTAGARVIFNPDAISYQYYDVDPAVHLRRAYESGRAQVALAVKHQDAPGGVTDSPHFHAGWVRWLLGPFIFAPAPVADLLRAVTARAVRSGRGGNRLKAAFVGVRAVAWHRGARAARRAIGTATVLAFHAVTDLSDDDVLAQYGISRRQLERHLDALAARRCHFIDLERLRRALRYGEPLPRKAVLITFDDGYADFLTDALPVLVARGIPACVFVVAGRVGSTNTWDEHLGGQRLPLLDADGIRGAAAAGVEIGAHGMTHRPLRNMDAAELQHELEGAAGAIATLGVPRPRGVSYPHGVCSAEVVAAARAAGYELGFTIAAGVATGGTNVYTVPRIEVLATDTPRTVFIKVTAARLPVALWRPRVRRILRVPG